MTAPGDALDLIDLVYDVALSEDSWDPLLQRATEVFHGTAAVFFVQDRVASEVSFARLHGLPELAMEQFEAHFAPLDVGLEKLDTLPAGTTMSDEGVAPSVYQGSEFFNDFRRPWKVERFLACETFRDSRRRGVFAIQAPWKQPFRSDAAAEMDRLRPHLRKAIQLATHLQRASDERMSLEAVIDALPTAVLILDQRGIVQQTNAAARRIDAARDGLTIREGRPFASSNGADRALQAAIQGALAPGREPVSAALGAFPVERPSGAPAYSVLVTPGPGRDARSPLREASAIVLIGDADVRLQAETDLVANLYGLTPAEARLASALASGEALAGYATRANLALSTARSTLKQVQAKTGIRRQAGLVRLLWTGPAGLGGVTVEGEEDS